MNKVQQLREEHNLPEPKETELITKIQLQNTPFWLIGNQENGFHIMLGQYRLTQEPLNTNQHVYTTQDIALDWLHENQWNIILQLIIIINQKQQ